MSRNRGDGQARRPRTLERARVGWPRALRELKDLLYEAYLAAGAPSLDEIAAAIAGDDRLPGAPSRDTVRRCISESTLPASQADAVSVSTALARGATWNVQEVAARVRALWIEARMATGAGRPIAEFDDRLILDDLEVHPALDTGAAQGRFGALPAYVPREFDGPLARVVDSAVTGHSGVAVLVGGSSTGKTRSLWEAVRELPERWRLWHPISPTRPDAVLAELDDIAPYTVVWLNEAHYYLAPDTLGEQVAAGLRSLLRDPGRAPVLVLATLWPEHWDALTTGTSLDAHPQARELLKGHKIDVPDTFTRADLAALADTLDVDPRLKEAAKHAREARIIQYLAGAPALLDRYQAARGATRALIHAAMDARRLGAGPHIPLAWLTDTALGYLTDTELNQTGHDWLPKALDYVTTPCNGIPGILTLVNTNAARNRRTSGAVRSATDPHARLTPGPLYQLADYLDQHGRRERTKETPPTEFWCAAATHAHPADLNALGDAAWDRGFLRIAAQLHKRATAFGNPYSATFLVRYFRIHHPTDQRPAQWAAAYVALDAPHRVALLLGELRAAGAKQQITALLARDPAAHVTLDDPDGVARLLEELRRAGAEQQVSALLARDPAAHVALDDPHDVAVLLKELCQTGAEQQTVALAERAAAHVALDDPDGVARLLEELRNAGAEQQVSALLARDPAAHVAAVRTRGVGRLLKALREAGAEQPALTLAERVATHVALDDPYGVAKLLEELREARMDQQAVAFAERAAAHVALDDPRGVAMLVTRMREASTEQALVLAERAVTHVRLDDPHGLAILLARLREAEAREQALALAERAATRVALDDPRGVAMLLTRMREASTEQALVLAERAATHVALEDPLGVAMLLARLREAEANQQMTTLLARDPAARVTLGNPYSVAMLLLRLREAGANQQITTLLARDPAAHVTLRNPQSVAMLLKELQETGAHEQARVLTMRLPALKQFDMFVTDRDRQYPFPLGLEPDGSAALTWTWEDLE
ncbi:hypothetical protein [Streptomyces sp. NPDC048191]|uniref:hypothetical protein n=1 Tax=Streptomyces sp. NPDC048191 TaxID=3155484 RepID=UPI0033DF1B83